LITAEEACDLYEHQDKPEAAKRIARLNVEIGPVRQKRLSKETNK